MLFENRKEAGQQLAAALAPYRNRPAVVLALPRGGVPIAAEIAAALEAPLDLILVRKVGLPEQPELAMGAVADGLAAVIVRNEEVLRFAGVAESLFQDCVRSQLQEIERRRLLYLAGRQPLPVDGRIAIVVDDGIATGATMRAALRATRLRNPKKLVLAAPVAATGTLESLRSEADDVVCLETRHDFGGVGAFYLDFRQVTDQEVTALLAAARDRFGHGLGSADAERDAPSRGEA